MLVFRIKKEKCVSFQLFKNWNRIQLVQKAT